MEKLKAEQKEIDKLKNRTAGGSGESDTFRLKDLPDDFVSEVGETKE